MHALSLKSQVIYADNKLRDIGGQSGPDSGAPFSPWPKGGGLLYPAELIHTSLLNYLLYWWIKGGLLKLEKRWERGGIGNCKGINIIKFKKLFKKICSQDLMAKLKLKKKNNH